MAKTEYIVIDTNILLAANNASDASATCVLTCVRALNDIKNTTIVVIDDKWRILKEYKNKLDPTLTGVGDAFLKWLLLNWTKVEHVEMVALTEVSENEFVEFPQDPAFIGFDPPDRKFIAVANAHVAKPSILQALDSKWVNFRPVFAKHNITVDFICPKDVGL